MNVTWVKQEYACVLKKREKIEPKGSQGIIWPTEKEDFNFIEERVLILFYSTSKLVCSFLFFYFYGFRDWKL